MTALPIPANTLPSFSPAALFARIAGVFSVFLDVYAEALQQASDAEKRYPFASSK